MKLFLAFVLSLVILFKNQPALPVCNLQTVFQSLPPKIFFEQTIDGKNQPVLITRFFHNKIGIMGSEAAKCYFNLFDPVFLMKTLSIVGLPFFIYFLYSSLIKMKIARLLICLMLPLVPFFNFPFILVTMLYKIFAIIGLRNYLYK